MPKFIFVFLILFIGCDQNNSIEKHILKEVESLDSVEKQRQFLINIYKNDQEVRRNETKVTALYGYDSQEYSDAFDLMKRTDDTNLIKVETYLKTYGHPTIAEHGKEACGTPWLVIHHATKVNPRRRNFKYIYQAYIKGDIDEGAITFYLNRLYDMEFGKRIEWNRPYKVEEELDTLYKSLKLESIIKKVDHQEK